MATPDYIVGLRKHVGHDLLWLPSVSAVVRNDAGELLLGQRADDGRWSVVSGFVEPGEQPATALVREVREETGLEVAPVRLSSAVSHPHTYPNGDRCEYLNLGFLCRLVSGTARVNDDESLAVGGFHWTGCPSWTSTPCWSSRTAPREPGGWLPGAGHDVGRRARLRFTPGSD
ncbi:NUDIX domain-containing protein [Micromonospora sp. M12]